MSDTLLTRSVSDLTLGSIVARIKREIHKARDTDDDSIKLEICSAIQHYSGERFFFNEGNYTFLTVADQAEYGMESEIGAQDGYPEDLLKLDIVRIKKNSNQIYTLKRSTFQEIRYFTLSNYSGYPDCYAWHHKKIFFYPAPNTADWEVIIDYVKDIGTPRYSHSGTFSFEETVTGSAVTDNWTSPWFTHAEELIRARVEWGLFMNYYVDYSRAEGAKIVEMAALDSLRADTDNYNFPGDAVPWGLDYWVNEV